MEYKVPSKLQTTCVRALSESLETRTMVHIIKDILPDYDVHARTGIPESLAIPNKEVSKQIVNDVIEANRFLSFVSMLIRIHEDGHMGRKYSIAYLRDIVRGTYELGFLYDKVNKLFVENQNVRYTRNWGVLRLGEEYTMAFLAIDIVGNTSLVRKHSGKTVKETYNDLRKMVLSVTFKRNGRLWDWEGDGGLVAFFFGNKHMSAALCAMEILHELFLYNRTDSRLDEPLQVRIGIHAGPCEYTDNNEDLKEIPTVQETYALEKLSDVNQATISIVVKVMLEDIVSQKFAAVRRAKNGPFAYALEFDS